jgi:hypothetical protein
MAAPKKANPKSSEIKFRATPGFVEELKEMAEKKGIPLSSLITLWLKERLEAEKG